MEYFVASNLGLEIPSTQINYIKWVGKIETTYSFELNDSNPAHCIVMLNTNKALTLKRLAMVGFQPEPIELEVYSYPMFSDKQVFTESGVYSELDSNKKERVIGLIDTLSKYTFRRMENNKRLAQLQNAWDDKDNLPESVRDLLNRVKRANKEITTATNSFHSLANKMTGEQSSEEMDVADLIKSDVWDNNAHKFYERMLYKNHNVNNLDSDADPENATDEDPGLELEADTNFPANDAKASDADVDDAPDGDNDDFVGLIESLKQKQAGGDTQSVITEEDLAKFG